MSYNWKTILLISLQNWYAAYTDILFLFLTVNNKNILELKRKRLTKIDLSVRVKDNITYRAQNNNDGFVGI